MSIIPIVERSSNVIHPPLDSWRVPNGKPPWTKKWGPGETAGDGDYRIPWDAGPL